MNLISALLTASDVQQVFGLSSRFLIPIFFVVSLGLFMWVIFDLKKTNEKLLDSRPTIDVEIVREDETFYLKVHNMGETGVFKAQFELTSKEPSVGQLRYYNGHWRFANNSEAQIMRNQTDMIKVAERVLSTAPSVCLRIFYNDGISERSIATSSHRIGAYVPNTNGSIHPMTKWEYDLSVSISSSPSLRESIYHKRYTLNVDKLEVNTNSQLTSHK